MSENLSVKYYQKKKKKKKKRKKDYKIKVRERYQNLSKEEKNKKSNNMVVNVTKISQKMKNKSLLSIEKTIIECEKMLYYNYKKVF